MKYITQINKYQPINEQEHKDKKLILEEIERYGDAILHRHCKVAHLTSSGFILNESITKTLMIHHNIYQTWAWTGGHADGDRDLLAIAIKEAKEETGVKNITPLTEEIVSIDILPVYGHIKRGEYVSTHLHLSVAYALIADENEAVTVKEDENSGVKWLDINCLDTYCKEPEVVEIYKKIIQRARRYRN